MLVVWLLTVKAAADLRCHFKLIQTGAKQRWNDNRATSGNILRCETAAQTQIWPRELTGPELHQATRSLSERLL